MADIRIKDLATTAASTASDDFVAVDGSANGTRKLNAYSPTFGGNLTVNGTGTNLLDAGTGTDPLRINSTAASPTWIKMTSGATTLASIARVGNDFVLKGGTSGAALTLNFGDTGASFSGNLTVSGQTTNLGTGGASIQAYSSGTMRLYSASGQAIALFDGGSAGLTLDGSHNATLAGNLTVSGTGNSSVAGTFLVATTTNSSNGRIQLATHTTSAGGIGFGTDTAFYRQTAGRLAIDYIGGTSSMLMLRENGSTVAELQTVAGDFYISTATAGKSLYLRSGAGTTALTLDSSQNATFAGKITANGAGSTFKGTSTNDDAAAGYVGEIITSTVESGSAVSLTSATLANITSISLTAGDWDVFGVVGYSLSGATVQSFLNALNNTSAAIGPTGSYTKDLVTLTTITDNALLPTPVYRFTLTSTSTVYLIGRANFTAGTVSGWGHIRARRVR